MSENDPSAIEPLKHPPGLSPEKPEIKRRPRSYNPYQIKEALTLAKTIGVGAAAKACGVSIWAIYKAGSRPQNARKKGDLPKVRTPPMELMVSAAKLALYWSSNIPQTRDKIRIRKASFDRAALKYKINPIILWNEYTNNRIEGVPYP